MSRNIRGTVLPTTISFAATRSLIRPPLALTIMAGACANGFVVQAVEHLSGPGQLGLTLGIGPFQLITFLVAAKLSWVADGSIRTERLSAVDILALALILVPSSAVSWATLSLYAGAMAAGAEGQRRTGALLFLGLALTAIWSSVVLKWIAGPVTTGEAYLVGKIIAQLRADVVQLGNVVGVPEAHNLILMTRCTTADAIPTAMLSLVSVALLLGRIDKGRVIRACACLVVLYAAANLVRLAWMAWSEQAYALVHGPIGASVFDVLQIVAVLALGNWVTRR